MTLYLSFFAASVLLALSPGPDNLYVLVQSLDRGARAGIVITLGLCTGLVLQTSLVALGVAQFIQQSTWALPMLALFGAGYLGYLAWQSWTAPTWRIASVDASEQSVSGWYYYRRGVILNASNPKVLLFFLAFLPQFVRGDTAVAQQIVALGGLFILAALVVFCAIALISSRLAAWMANCSGAGKIVNRLVALVFGFMALRLAAAGAGLLPLIGPMN